MRRQAKQQAKVPRASAIVGAQPFAAQASPVLYARPAARATGTAAFTSAMLPDSQKAEFRSIIGCINRLYFIQFRRSMEMYTLRVLLWVSALVRFPENSRFGGINGKINSRFGATGIACKELNRLTFTAARRPLNRENRKNSRFDGNNRERPWADGYP